MNKDFTKHNQALALKELGFNEDCLSVYQKNKKLKHHSEPSNNFWTDEELMGTPKTKGDLIQDFTKEEIFKSRSHGEKFEKIAGTMAPTYSQAFRWFREKTWIDRSTHSIIYILPW